MNDDNDESRRVVEHCYRTTSTMVNPIVDWTDSEVWDFLHHYGCESNPLYKDGFKRIGCVGCPLSGEKKQLEKFERYPQYKKNYIRAFDRMLKNKKAENIDWKTGEDVFNWWVGIDKDQMTLDEFMDMENEQ